MAKPSNSNERNLFTDIDLQIMLCNEKIKNHRRSIEKVKKMCGWYGPSGIGGIDYSKESFPSTHISFAEGLEMIDRDTEKINQLTEERKDLRRTMRRVKKIYAGLSGMEAQVYYCRVIQNRKRYEGQRADLKRKFFETKIFSLFETLIFQEIHILQGFTRKLHVVFYVVFLS